MTRVRSGSVCRRTKKKLFRLVGAEKALCKACVSMNSTATCCMFNSFYFSEFEITINKYKAQTFYVCFCFYVLFALKAGDQAVPAPARSLTLMPHLFSVARRVFAELICSRALIFILIICLSSDCLDGPCVKAMRKQLQFHSADMACWDRADVARPRCSNALWEP